MCGSPWRFTEEDFYENKGKRQRLIMETQFMIPDGIHLTKFLNISLQHQPNGFPGFSPPCLRGRCSRAEKLPSCPHSGQCEAAVRPLYGDSLGDRITEPRLSGKWFRKA